MVVVEKREEIYVNLPHAITLEDLLLLRCRNGRPFHSAERRINPGS
jgi:hypothetical protein